MSILKIQEKFPVHYLVWHNCHEELDRLLTISKVNMETYDPRGRTPLHLAVALGHLESVRILLQQGANANAENNQYWTVVQESIATGDPEIVLLCLQHRDCQRYLQRASGIPALLTKLTESPDFYVEMKWEFTSWVPLVSRVCPSDIYRVWKCGSSVRIDTTLLSFDNMNWQRGSRSYIFKSEANTATFMEIDHDAHQVYTEIIKGVPVMSDVSLLTPSQNTVAARLTSPIVTTYIDTERITFERSKSGLWGWKSDKSEVVNGYNCKVFNASNVHLVTKTRTEHLTEQDKKRSKTSSRSPLESLLGVAEKEDKLLSANLNGELATSFHNPCHVTPEEYFDVNVDLSGRDIGRPMEQSSRVQNFKAQLCLCENYPLSLPEQVLPVIDLMAASNAHFQKLRDFITLQLPSGFPVKIEIPLFHVLNAKITFGNIFASEVSAPGVICVHDGGSTMCTIDDDVFSAPSTYSLIGDLHHERLLDEDDELLQFAIQQSLLDCGSENDQVTLWEALNKSKSGNYTALQSHEEQLLQKALEESMGLSLGQSMPIGETKNITDDDEQLKRAIELSEHDRQYQVLQQKQEEEELERILQLSLTEK